MKLNFRILGEGKPLIILHGVFGSADNWQTVGKILAEQFKVYLVDLRNHGNSPHSDEFNYQLMAEDIIELMNDENIESGYLLGHSMGGKVAMNVAMSNAERIEKLIVVDIAPRAYPPHHQQIFEGFESVKLESLKSRGEADNQMSAVIANIGIRQFILKNLARTSDGTFRWKLNLEAIKKATNSIGDSTPEELTFVGKTLFIGGSKSDYIQKTDHIKIKKLFPNSEIEIIEGAGHWVHAEKPKELIEIVQSFLN